MHRSTHATSAASSAVSSHRISTRRRGAALTAVLLVLGACGSGSGDGESAADGATNSPAADDAGEAPGSSADGDTSTDAGTPAAPAGPIDGAVVSLLSIDLGLFSIDATAGTWAEVPVPGLDFVDRNAQPVNFGGGLFTLGFTTLPEQSFSHVVSVVRVDTETGVGEQLFELGVDRQDDDATDSTSFGILGATSAEVLIRQNVIANGESSSALVRYDIDTGEILNTLDEVVYAAESDSGSCSADVRRFTPVGDTVYAFAAGRPIVVDLATGELEPLLDPCSNEGYTLDTLVDAATASTSVLTDTGAPLTTEQMQSLLEFSSPTGTDNAVAADGALWWTFTTVRSFNDDDGEVTALFGALVRFDLATNDLALLPLGEFAGRFFEPGSDFDLTTIEADIAVVDGTVVLVDRRENEPLLVVDTASGAITPVPIETGTGPEGEPANSVRVELLETDPDRLWLLVDRGVSSANDDGSTSTRFVTNIELIDVATGAAVHSIPTRDIIGF